MTGDAEETLRRLEGQIGEVVEVWVPDADLHAWNSAVDALRAKGYRVELMDAGAPVVGPLAPHMFSDADDHGMAFEMYVDVGDGRWWTGLYSEETIDFQGRPEWITSVPELAEVSAFMQVLADATGKESIFIPESLDGNVKRYMTRHPGA
ncbi:hypothetical protein [Streptomyces sp. NPDC013489]|uniref:hypothetical protein n=1 Tax=Streptomyces sp. NPDC013489 TaxID=3155606 RepID=UPI0033C35EF9